MAQTLLADSFLDAQDKMVAEDKLRLIEFVSFFRKNPAHPSISLERVTNAKSDNVWSGRITQDLRAILYKDGDTWAILYADHHDAAYKWAESRDIKRHSSTGALQVVKSVETIQEVVKKIVTYEDPQGPPLFKPHKDDYLLSLGVPENWLPTIRSIYTDEQLLSLCNELSDEVAERLFDVASGEIVAPPQSITSDQPVTAHPDIQRRFFILENDRDLQTILEAPLHKWIAFLHPSQRAIVEGTFNGPVKVSGAAGTGKTVVAMHRARYLARKGKRVLLTSFVTTLCSNIERTLRLFCQEDELNLITVVPVYQEATNILEQAGEKVNPATDSVIDGQLKSVMRRLGGRFDFDFVKAEWEHVIQVQGIRTWDEYLKARRVGRGVPLSAQDRKALWEVFERVFENLAARGLIDWAGICHRATALLESGQAQRAYDAVIVDEVQDLKPPQLRFVQKLCEAQIENLMVVGDPGQRIYPGGFSLRALGIEVRGRAHILRINYRTTEQIRKVADRLLGDGVDDMDGGTESRHGVRSLIHGPDPVLKGFHTAQEEIGGIVQQVQTWVSEGLAVDEIGIFARTAQAIKPVWDALETQGISCYNLAVDYDMPEPSVSLGTMHRAKGLEFKAVVVMGCANGKVPNQMAFRGLDDPADREDAEAREKRLLYVSMTRARDELLVTWVGKPSPFLNDLLEMTT